MNYQYIDGFVTNVPEVETSMQIKIRYHPRAAIGCIARDKMHKA